MRDPCCKGCYKLSWQRPSWNFIQDRHKSSTRKLSSSTFPLSLLCSSQLFTGPWLLQQGPAGCSNTRFTMPGLARLEHEVLKHTEQDARGAKTPHGTQQVFLFYRNICFWYKKQTNKKTTPQPTKKHQCQSSQSTEVLWRFSTRAMWHPYACSTGRAPGQGHPRRWWPERPVGTTAPPSSKPRSSAGLAQQQGAFCLLAKAWRLIHLVLPSCS